MRNVGIAKVFLFVGQVRSQIDVKYQRLELSTPDFGNTETEVTRWETIKIVKNPVEAKKCDALRTTLNRRIRAQGYQIGGGPVAIAQSFYDETDELAAEIADEVNRWNAAATDSSLEFSHFTVELAQDDEKAIRSVRREVASLVREMSAAIESMDVERIRKAVTAARGMEGLLPEDASRVLKEAFKASRKAATDIKREVEKKGRQIEAVKRELDLSQINLARLELVEKWEADEEAFKAAEPAEGRFDVERAPLDDGGGVTATGYAMSAAVTEENPFGMSYDVPSVVLKGGWSL